MSRVRVSRAWWPLDVQRCIATNKAAQRRRSVAMKAAACNASTFWVYSRLPGVQHKRFSVSERGTDLRFFSIVGGSILLLSAMTLAAFLLQHWLSLFPLALIWCFVVVRLPRLFFWRRANRSTAQTARSTQARTPLRTLRRRRKQLRSHIITPVIVSAPEPVIAPTPEPVIAPVQVQEQSALIAPTPPVLPVAASVPTPVRQVPVTPLVRVLETFDLSNSDVEHFIDTAFALRAVKGGLVVPQTVLPESAMRALPASEMPQYEPGSLTLPGESGIPQSEQSPYPLMDIPLSELGSREKSGPGEAPSSWPQRVASEIVEYEHPGE